MIRRFSAQKQSNGRQFAGLYVLNVQEVNTMNEHVYAYCDIEVLSRKRRSCRWMVTTS
jgi:hypothetical protein